MNEIQNWLANKSRTFTEGLRLYNKYKQNNRFDGIFRGVTDAKPNTFQYKKLVGLLSTFSRLEVKIDIAKQPIEPKQIIVNVVKQKAAALRIDEHPTIRIEELPENLRIEYNRAKELTREISGLHAKAKVSTNDEDRKETINKAMKLEDDRADIWKKIDAWDVERKQPAKLTVTTPVIDAMEAIKLQGRIEDLKTSINRIKKELNEQKKKPVLNMFKIAKKEGSLAKFETELSEKTNLLNQIINNAK